MTREDRLNTLRAVQIKSQLIKRGEWCFEHHEPKQLCKCGKLATLKPDAHLGAVRG